MGRRPKCSAGMRSHCSRHRVARGRAPTRMTILPPYTSTMLGHIGLSAPLADRVRKPCWRPFLVPALCQCVRREGHQGGRHGFHKPAWAMVGSLRGRRQGRMSAC
jgi:hypothetical protein